MRNLLYSSPMLRLSALRYTPADRLLEIDLPATENDDALRGVTFTLTMRGVAPDDVEDLIRSVDRSCAFAIVGFGEGEPG